MANLILLNSHIVIIPFELAGPCAAFENGGQRVIIFRSSRLAYVHAPPVEHVNASSPKMLENSVAQAPKLSEAAGLPGSPPFVLGILLEESFDMGAPPFSDHQIR